jgi:hypothetical protein
MLMVSGVVIALWGMSFGLYYALFVEHQTLERIGSALAQSFIDGARGDLLLSRESLQTHADARFNYVRSVDVHSHWIGLAMLLILLGVVFDRAAIARTRRALTALLLVLGSIAFPLGVMLQTLDRGFLPQTITAVGAGLVIVGLAGVLPGIARIERE